MAGRRAFAHLIVGVVLAVGCRQEPPRPAPASTAVAISLVLAGASAEHLEHTVVEPLEAALGSVAGVRAIHASIEEGHALVTVELAPARDVAKTMVDVRRAVGEAQPRLPAELEPPRIWQTRLDAPILWLALDGSLPAAELSELARDLIGPRLERVTGVAGVELLGTVERVIEIRPDLARLAASDLTLAELAGALREASVAVPAGRIGSADLRVAGSVTDVASLGSTVVGSRGDASVRLVDVASIAEANTAITDGAAPTRGPPRARAAPAIGVRIQVTADERTVQEAIRAELAAVRASLPPGLTVTESAPPPRAGPPSLAVSLRCPDPTTLAALADTTERDLRTSGLTGIGREPPAATPELRLELDRARAADLGVALPELAATVRILLGDERVGSLRSGARDQEVLLRVATERADLPELLVQVQVRSPRIGLLPLSELATITTGATQPVRRRDRARAITLSIDEPGPAVAAARRRIHELTSQLPPGCDALVSPAR